MILLNKSLEEYRAIYKADTGEDITLDEAREICFRVITLIEIITQPLPGETGRVHLVSDNPEEDQNASVISS